MEGGRAVMNHLKHSEIAHLDRALDSRARELRKDRDLLMPQP